MYCKKCGNKVSDDVSFCPKCGQCVSSEKSKNSKSNYNIILISVIIVLVLVLIFIGCKSFIASSEQTIDDLKDKMIATETTQITTVEPVSIVQNNDENNDENSDNTIQNNIPQNDVTDNTNNIDDNTILTDSQIEEFWGCSRQDLVERAKNTYLKDYSEDLTLNDVFGDRLLNIEWKCTEVYKERYMVECHGQFYDVNTFMDLVVPINVYKGSNDALVFTVYIEGSRQSYDATRNFLEYAYGSYYDEEEYPWAYVLISQDELNQYTKDELNFSINHIYAKHGYIFSNPIYKEHFEQQRWYKPQYTDPQICESEFNYYERENIKIMTSYAKSKGWRK